MRRFVVPGEVGAWVPDGRWGPRRVRTCECAAVVTAEDTFDVLLGQPRVKMRVGARGELRWRVAEQVFKLEWSLRANSLSRIGRLHLSCPVCSRPVRRLYLAAPGTRTAACRSCLGLSYASRSLNYRDVGPLRWLEMSSRDFAKRETALRRQAARRAARRRAEYRRGLRLTTRA
jgi:hypothetical protein